MNRVWFAAVVAAVSLVAVPASAGASTYTNPNTVELPDDLSPLGEEPRTGSPYPSTITVADLPGTVTRARASLNNLSHSFADDLVVVLVAPAGGYTVLMHNACGNPDLVDQTLTFDDAAPTELSDEGPCVSGTYKPTNLFDSLSGPPTMPPPAPQGDLTNTAMSFLNGSPASGTWQLFIEDQGFPDDPPPSHILAGGWTLDLLTDATCSRRPATLTGTAGPDELEGTPEDDVILGFGGKDTIRGLGGRDTICGGPGKDILRGGSGKDKLRGEGGKDKLSGGGGKDRCIGGRKDDAAKKCEVEKSI